MRRQHKILVTTKLGRPDAARVAVKLEEAHDGAYADPALLGSFRYRSAGINRLDHARSQVLRIRLRHPCWPPPAGSLNQIRRGVKIPDSAFSGNALESQARLLPRHSADLNVTRHSRSRPAHCRLSWIHQPTRSMPPATWTRQPPQSGCPLRQSIDPLWWRTSDSSPRPPLSSWHSHCLTRTRRLES